MKTFLWDFVILWDAPTDAPAIKSIKEESYKINSRESFLDYIFGNLVISRKSN
ncbi:MAG: hypothetical protein PHE48_02525 [Candidatus Daviesbacteria bacterium]|nr:hypothetical protein [Candidatus Daviesbacteria bacterium]